MQKVRTDGRNNTTIFEGKRGNYFTLAKDELLSATEVLLDELSDDIRHELFHKYCLSCGTKDPLCQCWNDE